jgi:hypothetical protein
MVCGEYSDEHIVKNFRWFPEWVGLLILAGLLPYVIVAEILKKRMTVEVPVCERHRGYFVRRQVIISIVAVLLFILPISFGFLMLAVASTPKETDEAVTAGFFCFGVSVFPAVITIALIQNSTIRPAEITDRGITLKRVHEEFVDACDNFWRQQDYDDEFERPRRRPPREIEEVLPADEPSERIRARPRRPFRDAD